MFVLHFFNFSDTRLWGNSTIPICCSCLFRHSHKSKNQQRKLSLRNLFITNPTRSFKCQSSH
jgi:hypothetical protein